MTQKTCPNCKKLRRDANRLIHQYRASRKWNAERLIDWIERGTKDAALSFTSGPERQIAYAVERLAKRLLYLKSRRALRKRFSK